MLRLAASFLAMLALTAPEARAGGSSSHGLDARAGEEYVAWFSDAQELTYCIDRTDAFPVSEARIDRAVTRAFGVWRDYIGAKLASNRAAHLVTTTRKIACDGSEALRILVGATHQAVTERLEQFKSPAAF